VLYEPIQLCFRVFLAARGSRLQQNAGRVAAHASWVADHAWVFPVLCHRIGVHPLNTKHHVACWPRRQAAELCTRLLVTDRLPKKSHRGTAPRSPHCFVEQEVRRASGLLVRGLSEAGSPLLITTCTADRNQPLIAARMA